MEHLASLDGLLPRDELLEHTCDSGSVDTVSTQAQTDPTGIPLPLSTVIKYLNSTAHCHDTTYLPKQTQLAIMESIAFLNSLLSREGSQNQCVTMESLPFFDSLLPCEEPCLHTSLGLFEKLPREIRDSIYDLCHQKKDYHIRLRRENNPGTVRFSINAPLPQLRLVNTHLKSEYESRAPANAVMIKGCMQNNQYSYSLGDGDGDDYNYKLVPTPLFWLEESEQRLRPEDTKVFLFEIASVKTHDFKFAEHWLMDPGKLATPPEGSVAISLRFYDDLHTADHTELMRLFSNFQIDYTEEWGDECDFLRFKKLQLTEVTLYSGERRLSVWGDDVPKIGTWTPEGGFKLNGTPHGLVKVSECDDDKTGGADHDDGDRNDEADGATEEENTGDSNDSEQASQSGSEMDWQYDDVPEDPKAPQEAGKAQDDPGLGLMTRLPKMLRDGIYDMCIQEKRYEISDNGPVCFQVHAPLSHLRLVSKKFKSDYESRAPAHALLITSGTGDRYTFQLGDSAPKHVPAPNDRWGPKEIEIPAQYNNLNIVPFGLPGTRTETPKPVHWYNTRPQTPTGTFGPVLRFYKDPRSDLAGFLRVFDNMCFSHTQNRHWERLEPEVLRLDKVTFLLSRNWGMGYYEEELPEIGTWTAEDGFEFNGAADGILIDYSEPGDEEFE